MHILGHEVQPEPPQRGRMPPTAVLKRDIGVQLDHHGRIYRGVLDGRRRQLPEPGGRDRRRPGMNPPRRLQQGAQLGPQRNRQAARTAGHPQPTLDAQVLVACFQNIGDRWPQLLACRSRRRCTTGA